MSQDYVDILASDLLADAPDDLNDRADALRTDFSGPSAPASPVAYQKWYDTTTGYVKERNAANDAWIVIGVIGSSYHGALPRSGGTMTGAIAMGGYTITGLGLGTGTAAARQQEVDLKAPIAAPALTGDATVNQDPAGDNSLIRRSWAEARYAKLSGASMTGALLLGGYGGAASEAVPKSSIETMTSFHATTGHRHDGSDARRIRGEDVNSATAAAAGKILTSTAGGICQWLAPTISRVVYGTVSSIGGIGVAGSGDWTPSKISTGKYQITVSPVMSATPWTIYGHVLGTVGTYTKSTSVVEVWTYDLTGSLFDWGCDFIFLC